MGMSSIRGGASVARKVEKRVERAVLKQLASYSDVFGVPASRILTVRDRAVMRRKIRSWLRNASSFGTSLATDWNRLSLRQRKERMAKFLDRLLRLHSRVPKTEHALEWHRKQIERALTLPKSSALGRSYYRYSKATDWLVRQLFKQGRITIAQDFFSSFLRSRTAFSLAQVFVLQVLPDYRRLERLQTKRLEAKDVQKLISVYGTYAAVYEKQARILFALNRIRVGEEAEYSKVRKKQLYDVVEELRSEPRLRILTTKFNRHIRNAIAHSTYTVLRSRRTVVFTNSSDLEISWTGFRRDTAGLSLLVFAVAVTPFLHYWRTVLSRIGKMLKVVEK